jgi:hypothetical protein
MIWCIVPIVLKLLKVQGNVVAGTTVKTPFNRQSTAKKTSSPVRVSSLIGVGVNTDVGLPSRPSTLLYTAILTRFPDIKQLYPALVG